MHHGGNASLSGGRRVGRLGLERSWRSPEGPETLGFFGAQNHAPPPRSSNTIHARESPAAPRERAGFD